MNTHSENLSTFDKLTRGALEGAIGGIAGGGVKLLGEIVFPPRGPGEPIPPEVMVSRLLGAFSRHPLMHEKMTAAVQSVRWSFSIAVGLVYGAIVEIFPKAKIG